MKTKLYKILGVALTLVLLASLTAGLATVPAGAASSNLKFTKLELPCVEAWGGGADWAGFIDSEGDFWATPGTDLGPIAQTPDGEILFAAVTDYPHNPWPNWCDVLKSTDGGYSWIPTGFNEEWLVLDTSEVVDIVTSPDYSEDTTVIVATRYYVYQSVDGGKNFVCMEDSPPWATIRDLDVTLDDRGRMAFMVGGRHGSFDESDVFVFSTDTGLQWQAQLIDIDIDEDGVYDPGDGDIDYDVLACSFSPFFADDGGIVAVVTGDINPAGPPVMATKMRFSISNTAEGGGWGTDIMDATFVNANLIPFESWRACIGFPDDFDFFGIGNNICFVGIYGDDSTDQGGDVYKMLLKEAGTSKAIDLDIRGVLTTLAPTSTDIVSIDVCGDAEEATILVGTDECNLGAAPEIFLTYHSEDSGDSWQFSFKPPTGGDKNNPASFTDARARVLMAPDFCDTGVAYASTRGDTSGFSRTTDGANSFNQISLIDYDEYWACGYGFDATGYNADGTLRMITSLTPGLPPQQGDTGALFERTDGKHWERIFSYANHGVTNDLCQLIVIPDAIFAVDIENNCMWRSTDGGATWPKKITTKPDLQKVTAVSATTLYTSHGDGVTTGGIWWSTKSGVGWTKPDDSDIPNTVKVGGITVMGDIVLTTDNAGAVYISTDGGETVEKVGKTDPGVAGSNIVTADLGFGTNNILYCVTLFAEGHGIWRTEVDLDTPSDSKWEQIDTYQDSTGAVVYNNATVVCGSPAITLPPAGVLYVIDMAYVDTAAATIAGGLWRSTNATADTDSVRPPYFEKENKGMTGDGDTWDIGAWPPPGGDDPLLSLLGLDLAPPSLAPTFFCANNNTTYDEQIVMFTDILNVGVPLASPTADETGVGLLPEGYVYPEVNLAWQEMAGATSYQYQVAIDPDFKTVVTPPNSFTNSLATPPLELNPNTTYYWRVRVANQGSLVGAPLISPWSETWKFKTAIGASMARPDLQAPWPGEPDVPLSPTFEWSGIEWAEVYEYELALDPATTAGGYFTEPLVALVGTNSLVSTAWKCDMTLDYNTRYYWHVKAIGVDTDTPWSDVGTFTTMGVPPEPPEAQPPVVIPPAENITPAWIWAIVIIGAILVIAVIVLIVTTRRVP